MRVVSIFTETTYNKDHWQRYRNHYICNNNVHSDTANLLLSTMSDTTLFQIKWAITAAALLTAMELVSVLSPHKSVRLLSIYYIYLYRFSLKAELILSYFVWLFLDAYYTFQISIKDPKMNSSYVLSLVSLCAHTEHSYMCKCMFYCLSVLHRRNITVTMISWIFTDF